MTLRRLTRVAVLILAALAAAAGAWWYLRPPTPERLARDGQEAILRGDWKAALAAADQLDAAGDPDRAHLVRGHSYLRRARQNDAMLNRAIVEYNQIRHDRSDVLAEASLTYGLGFYSLGKLAEAERFLVYVAQVRPDDAEARRGLAAVYYDLGAMDHAARHAQRWAELTPGDGQPHRFLGVIRASQAADADAVRHYRDALARDLPPRAREEAAIELAGLLVKQTQFAEALAVLDAAGGAAADLRAECLYNLDRRPEAVAVLDAAPADRPATPRALRVRALLHADAGAPEMAAPLLEEALRADPHDTACRHQLALAYDRLNRPADAAEQRRQLERSQGLLKELTDLSQEAAAKPRDAAVRRRLADVCRRLDRPALAEMWQRAADASPPTP
jgi:tetratricopeptide (TPR) repeat protein